ncbi:hypothetical protein MTO96_006734 [Rhipicephalus appendiculatus]
MYVQRNQLSTIETLDAEAVGMPAGEYTSSNHEPRASAECCVLSTLPDLSAERSQLLTEDRIEALPVDTWTGRGPLSYDQSSVYEEWCGPSAPTAVYVEPQSLSSREVLEALLDDTMPSQDLSSDDEQYVSEQCRELSALTDPTVEHSELTTYETLHAMPVYSPPGQHSSFDNEACVYEECTRASALNDLSAECSQVPTRERLDALPVYTETGQPCPPHLATAALPVLITEATGPHLPSDNELCVNEECSVSPAPLDMNTDPHQLPSCERLDTCEGCPDFERMCMVRTRRRHSFDGMCVCSECGSQFLRKESLDAHMTLEHYKCRLCAAMFPDIYRLTEHLIRHSYNEM